MVETHKNLQPVASSFPVRVNIHEALHQLRLDGDMRDSLSVERYFQTVDRYRRNLPPDRIVTAHPRLNGAVDLVGDNFVLMDARPETYTVVQ